MFRATKLWNSSSTSGPAATEKPIRPNSSVSSSITFVHDVAVADRRADAGLGHVDAGFAPLLGHCLLTRIVQAGHLVLQGVQALTDGLLLVRRGGADETHLRLEDALRAHPPDAGLFEPSVDVTAAKSASA